MPIYEFKCKKCRKVTELIRHVDDCPEKIKCSCGKTAKRIISTRGAVHTDGDVKWIPSARQVLQPDIEIKTRPIETRGQYEKYLKDQHLACVG
jgi:putative FmdB family regulatory protein